jgi:hypothetical protein
MTLTCHRRRILRPACCSRAGPQPGSTPGSPDPSPSTCCTAELHRSVLSTLSSSHHHKLVFSDCKHTDSSYMSLCRSSSRPDFKIFISQAMSFPYLTVLLILLTKKLESFKNYDSLSIFLSLNDCDSVLSCSSAWFLCADFI